MVKYCVFGFVCMWVRGCVGSWVVGVWVCCFVCVLVGEYMQVTPWYSWLVGLDVVYLVACVCGYVGVWVHELGVCG